jgi:hypothetical protein
MSRLRGPEAPARVIEAAGIEFVEENGGGLSVRFRKRFVDTADHLPSSALTISFQAARSDLMRFTSSGLRFRCAIFRS